MQHLQPNTTLQGGKYRIERVLGQGGFGITYLAVQTSLNRYVAIKEFFMKDYCGRDETTRTMFAPSVGSSKLVEQYRKKFIKEAKNLARLHHQNIISVIEVFEENDTVYYVMPYYAGGSLYDLVSKYGALSESEAMKYVRQIANALKYMHEEQHICHYDVKPANILLDDKGNAVLIDFGISKNYDSAGHETTSTPIGLSDGYAPIEQYNQNVEEFSPASDVYALGATLYFLLHGKRPVSAVHRASGTPLLMSSNLSQGVKNIINASTKVSKTERAGSVGVFLGNVNTSAYRERSVIGWIIGIVVVGIIGFIIFNSQRDEDNSGKVVNPVDSTIQSQETETKNKLVEAIQKANSEGSFLLSNNNQVYYLKDKMPSAGFDNTSSGCAHIYIFDVNNDVTSKVNIRLPSGLDDLQYEIDSYAITDDRITFILSQRGRNGFGVSNYTTEVTQFNTRTNKWRNLADGCAGAEFIEANMKIRLKFAEITNYDEVECAVDYEYDYTYKDICL